MTRGTTPTNTFGLPFYASRLVKLSIVYAQEKEILFEKTLTDITADGKNISVVLNQADTLKFNASKNVEIQIRCKLDDDSVLASAIITETVGRILKDGEL